MRGPRGPAEFCVLKDLSAAQLLLALMGVGALIAWHELGHYAVARLMGMRVLAYAIGFGPRVLRVVRGDIEYRLCAFPLGGYVQIAGMTRLEPGATDDPRSFVNAPRWARIATVLAGPVFNFLLAFALFWIFFFSWPGGSLTLSEVRHDTPWAAAGLQDGDRVYAIEGRQIRQPSMFLESLSTSSPMTLYVLRGEGDDARPLEATLPPLSPEAPGWPFVSLRFDAFDVGVAESASRAAQAVVLYSGKTLAALGKLLGGDEATRAATSGPPGIVKELKDAAKRGLPDFLWLLAFLNLSLGLLNLLPIPALDGIKVLILAGEGLFRREVNPYALAIVNLVGIVLLLGLIAIVSIRDVTKLLG